MSRYRFRESILVGVDLLPFTGDKEVSAVAYDRDVDAMKDGVATRDDDRISKVQLKVDCSVCDACDTPSEVNRNQIVLIIKVGLENCNAHDLSSVLMIGDEKFMEFLGVKEVFVLLQTKLAFLRDLGQR